MPNRTLEQLRMEHAWRCAGSAQDVLSGDEYDKYVNAVKNLPAQITTNGLGQAVAYLAANGRTTNDELRKPEGYLYRHVESWLTDRAELEDANAPKGTYAVPVDDKPKNTKLIFRIAHKSSSLYRRATSEALAYLSALRFLAEAKKVGAPPAKANEDDSDADVGASDITP